jgi:hypothetical protein
LQRYRTGAEGRISHLKRAYGLRRSQLKGDEGHQIRDRWGDVHLQHRHLRHPRLTKTADPQREAESETTKRENDPKSGHNRPGRATIPGRSGPDRVFPGEVD